jgi:hypothetical protein
MLLDALAPYSSITADLQSNRISPACHTLHNSELLGLPVLLFACQQATALDRAGQHSR